MPGRHHAAHEHDGQLGLAELANLLDDRRVLLHRNNDYNHLRELGKMPPKKGGSVAGSLLKRKGALEDLGNAAESEAKIPRAARKALIFACSFNSCTSFNSQGLLPMPTPSRYKHVSISSRCRSVIVILFACTLQYLHSWYIFVCHDGGVSLPTLRRQAPAASPEDALLCAASCAAPCRARPAGTKTNPDHVNGSFVQIQDLCHTCMANSLIQVKHITYVSGIHR